MERLRVALVLVLAAALLGLGLAAHPPAGAAAPATGPAQADGLALVAHAGGVSRALALSGTRLVLGIGPSLAVADLPPGQAATILGQVDLPGVVYGLALGPRYAFVAAGFAGLQVVDLADPRAPRVVASRVDAGGAEAWDLFLEGDKLYLADRTDTADRLSVLDVTDPLAPTVLGAFSLLDGGMADVDVRAGLATIADGEALVTVSFADPADPRELGRLDTPGEAVGVSETGGVAYVLGTQFDEVLQDWVDTVTAVSLADPAAPVAVGNLNAPNVVRGLEAAGDRVYLVEAGGLRVLGVANPAQPVERGAIELAGGPLALGLDGTKVAVGLGSGGALTVDAADPAAMRRLAELVVPGSPHDLALAGGRVVQIENVEAAGVRLVNVADPARPRAEGYAAALGEAWRVAVGGSHAYIADGLAGLQVLDIADPNRPSWVGQYSLAPDILGLAVVGDRVYVAAGEDGLGILTVVDPTQPRSLGGMDLPGEAWGVVVGGDRAFVAELDTVRALDISDPRAVRPLGAFSVEANAGNLALDGDRLYVPTIEGLVVVDVANPAAMREAGRVTMPDGANDVALEGGQAWVTSPAGLHRVDLGRLEITATYITPSYPEGVAAAGGLAYVAAYDGGLFIIGPGAAPSPTPSPTQPGPTSTSTPPGPTPTPTATGSGPTPTGGPPETSVYLPYATTRR